MKIYAGNGSGCSLDANLKPEKWPSFSKVTYARKEYSMPLKFLTFFPYKPFQISVFPIIVLLLDIFGNTVY